MPYGTYISAEGAQVQSLRMDVIANNLANVDTVGFKRELAIFQARLAEETARGGDYVGSGSVNDVGGGVEPAETRTDFSPGPLQETGNPTDLAIRGDAYFVVDRGGREHLTRAGNFAFQPDGTLVTQDGAYPVVGATGDPIQINPADTSWYVTPEGGIVQQGEIRYLALAQPDSRNDLLKIGENLFLPLKAPQAIEPGQRGQIVASGYLERSGVEPTTEMMQLIETARAFEANASLIRTQDQMLGTLIGRVLRV
jgi:flagellar basal-body rod protein FlgF/flagellar basal-body rod protein FlgG